MSNTRKWTHADHPAMYMETDEADEAGYLRVHVSTLELIFEQIGYVEVLGERDDR